MPLSLSRAAPCLRGHCVRLVADTHRHVSRTQKVEGTCSGRHGFIVMVTDIKDVGEVRTHTPAPGPRRRVALAPRLVSLRPNTVAPRVWWE